MTQVLINKTTISGRYKLVKCSYIIDNQIRWYHHIVAMIRVHKTTIKLVSPSL